MIKIFATIIMFFAVMPLSFANEHVQLKHGTWSFEGYFGTIDKAAAQRGYQVYKEVCANCHAISRLSYRNLEQIGFSAAEVKQIANGYQTQDGPNDAGDIYSRPALPSDHFVPPYPNEQAARAANGGAYPPDLSLIVKAREDGANYLYSLLNGYEEVPVNIKITNGMYYNKYFPGHQIAMPPPFVAGAVSYSDGTEASVEQMSHDVVNFLQFAAEPDMEARKHLGIKVIAFLFIMAILLFAAKKRIWANIK